MTYVYQWFGAVNGCAFAYGCMLGMASLAMRQAGYPGFVPQTPNARPMRAPAEPESTKAPCLHA
ncbi:hypothetical protein [Imhoffiella purpurea]|uniref:Uncharacterized protein n=1 Tax=Imhoffiella purpurea TaxID=1249627 RepID=W9V3T0_9GAMM|nr:hypothetical protein [Imhoffiella purpurea]EXJ14173.1 hypothetical protein D779_2844 [Imhoffiella purpurea]